MKRLIFLALAAMTFAGFAASQAAANLLANPGFEDDAVLDSEPTSFINGWSGFNNAATASANVHPVRSGIGSLYLPGPGGFFVPGAFQTFPANPGEIWDLQGYMLTPDVLPGDVTFGLLKIVFGDGVGDLPPGEILIGQAGPAANPGVESLPALNSTSTPNTWQFTQARGVAPAGTVEVRIFALMVDQSPGTGYFDDLVATIITEQPLYGDYNDNDVVDAADYTVWRNNLNTSFTLPNRDPANTGNVSDDDYDVWKQNFGMTLEGGGSVGGTNVPEPTTLFMATVFLACCGMLRRKK